MESNNSCQQSEGVVEFEGRNVGMYDKVYHKIMLFLVVGVAGDVGKLPHPKEK